MSSGTSGDATLIIEADTDNNNEDDNPKIMLKQDGALVIGEVGINGSASQYTEALVNSMFIGTITSSDASLQLITKDIARMTLHSGGNVGIGTNNPNEKLHVNGTTTITADIGVPTSNHWNTGSHTMELQNSDAGDVVLSFHRAGHSNAAIKHSSLGGLIFSGSGAFDANQMFLKSNGYLGIGTTTPASQLDIRTADNKGVWLNYNNESAVTFRPNNGNSVFHLNHGHDNRLYISHGGTVGAVKLMTFVNSGNVGIGTTTPDSKLTVAGNIHAQEVKVTINAGADFVFNDGYNLPKLEDVEKFVKENKHLPEIASEKEMQTNGLLLAEMNIKLLQKIEELTLYVIEQQKINNTQSEIIKEIQDKLKN